MADARGREQLRQEHEAFDRACRHNDAWFVLRLAMGYLGLVIMAVILLVAAWVLLHPATYGPLPQSTAAVALTAQVLGLGFGIARLVLLQPKIAGLTPATVAGDRLARQQIASGHVVVPPVDGLTTAREGREV